MTRCFQQKFFTGPESLFSKFGHHTTIEKTMELEKQKKKQTMAREKNNSSLGTPVSYWAIFNKVLKKRLNYTNRISLIIAFFLSILASIPSGSGVLMLPLKFLVLWCGLIITRYARDVNLRVESKGYRTLISQCVGGCLDPSILTNMVAYFIGGGLYFSVIFLQSSEALKIPSISKTVKPFINDKVVYFCYHSTITMLAYTLQQNMLDRDRLTVSYGIYRANPQSTLLAKYHQILRFALGLTCLLALVSPVTYILARSFIYKVIMLPCYWPLGLNHQQPPFNIGFLSFISTNYFVFLLLVAWETVNHVYNCYATIGCFDGKNPLSCQSQDRIKTLLSGLKDRKHTLAMTTSYQELAYICSSDNSSDRDILYNGVYKSAPLWNTILEEISLVLRTTLRDIRISVVASEPSFSQPNASFDYDNKHMSSFMGRYDSLSDSLSENVGFENKLLSASFQLKSMYQGFISSGLGTPFRKTIRRDAMARVPNPSVVGNSIIAMSSLVSNAQYEDRTGSVLETLTQVLQLLERVISTCGEYSENAPLNLDTDQDDSHIIALLHDLAMKNFFDLVIKNNAMLHDVVLPASVFKLAQWCINLAIENQRSNEKENEVRFEGL